MISHRCLFRVGVVVAALAGFSVPARATVNYAISLAQPEQHRFHVRITIPGVTGSVHVQMAAWDALYQIRDFADRVIGLRAQDASGPA
ncbi:MAG TPA: hypothetical protein VEH50_04410, partial [Methylomirabilota bacterium]|nr:hypothetical protein [Methylomirabilota bacterium]